jgi:hypothetical protein
MFCPWIRSRKLFFFIVSATANYFAHEIGTINFRLRIADLKYAWRRVIEYLQDAISYVVCFIEMKGIKAFCLLVKRVLKHLTCFSVFPTISRSAWQKFDISRDCGLTVNLSQFFEFNCLSFKYHHHHRGSRVRFSAGTGNFSLHHRVQNGSGAHPAPYPVVPGALSLGVKRPGREADHSPPSSVEVKECVELYLQFPNTPSWRGA